MDHLHVFNLTLLLFWEFSCCASYGPTSSCLVFSDWLDCWSGSSDVIQLFLQSVFVSWLGRLRLHQVLLFLHYTAAFWIRSFESSLTTEYSVTWRFIWYVGPQFYILGHGLYVFWCPARFVLFFFSSTLTIGESLFHSFIISKLNLMWNIHQIGTWCVHKNEHRCKVSSVVFKFLGIVLFSDFLLCDEACWLYVAQRLMINWALWPAWLLTVHSVSR